MPVTTVSIDTAEGPCNTDLIIPDLPDGASRHPVLIMIADAAGRRPAMTQMAERIAKGGWVVAIPDLFHRVGSPWDLLPPGPHDFHRFADVFKDDTLRARFNSEFAASVTNDEHVRVDIAAVIQFLDTHPEVRRGKVGVFGYCIGGNCALRAAEVLPERVGAVASFHGGDLATAAPNSPHLAVSRLKAEVYIGAPSEDPSFDASAKQMLAAALTTAKVRHTIETYAGTQHGFAVIDHPAYDEAASERHYGALAQIMGHTLGR